LLNARICPGCGLPMHLKGRQNAINGVCWVCNNSICPSSLSTLSVRHGSFFEGMKLSLSDVFTVIILWSEGMQAKDVASHYGINYTLGFDENTVRNKIVFMHFFGLFCQKSRLKLNKFYANSVSSKQIKIFLKLTLRGVKKG